MIGLVEFQKPYLVAGMILRFITKGFYVEEPVDFMVINPKEENCGLGLIEITGYHAGEIYVVFPKDSIYQPGSDSSVDSACALSRQWLEKNWNTWVCKECDIRDVRLIESYPVPKIDGL